MLEKTFPSTDKIKSVYAFVRNSLREDVKPIKFVLCELPFVRHFFFSRDAYSLSRKRPVSSQT